TDRWVFVKDLSRDAPRGALGATVLDSITLTAAEWQGLAPADAKPGSAWAGPEATARQFFLLLSATDTTFPDAREGTAVRLAGRVEKVEGGIATLAYEGEIAATHRGTKSEAREGKECSSAATLLGGVGVYDVTSGRLRALTLVFDGRFRNYAPYDTPAR